MTHLSYRMNQILLEQPELNQSKLAKISGASRGLVNHWVTGKVESMNIEYALRIEKKLGYCHIWLMVGRGKKLRNERSLDPRFVNLVQALENLEDHKLDQVKAIVEVLLKNEKS